MDAVLYDRISAKTDISEHLTTLYMLAVEHQCKKILELGTRTGESTLALCAAARVTGGRVHSIDIEPCYEAVNRIDSAELDSYWRFIQQDDMKADWTEQVDMLFIDTDHTYSHTLAELQKYEPLTAKLVVMHDVVHDPPVKFAAMEYFAGKNCRIYEYLNNNGLLVVFK